MSSHQRYGARKRRRAKRYVRDLGHRRLDRAYGCALRAGALGAAAVPGLVAATRSTSWEVRYRAAWALGLTRDAGALPVMVALLDDPSPEVRYDTASALGMLGQVGAVEPLLALAVQPNRADGLQSAATRGLIHLGRMALSRVLELARSATSREREVAAWGLGDLVRPEKGSVEPRSVAALAELTGDPEAEVRFAAVEVLFWNDTAWTRELLARRLDDPDERVRESARAALQRRDSAHLPLRHPEP